MILSSEDGTLLCWLFGTPQLQMTHWINLRLKPNRFNINTLCPATPLPGQEQSMSSVFSPNSHLRYPLLHFFFILSRSARALLACYQRDARNEGNKGNGAAPDLSRMVNFCYFFNFCGTLKINLCDLWDPCDPKIFLRDFENKSVSSVQSVWPYNNYFNYSNSFLR